MSSQTTHRTALAAPATLPLLPISTFPTWASLALASGSLGQSCISGGLTGTGVCDRLNLSRFGLGATRNLPGLQALGGETLGIDVSASLNGPCAPELCPPVPARNRVHPDPTPAPPYVKQDPPA